MSTWIDLRVNAAALEKVEQLGGGVEIRSWPSPYDVPEAAKSSFDEPTKLLRIQFKYINDEPLKRVVDEDGIVFGRGKNSHRLYEITVDMNKVAEVVKETVGTLASFIVKEIEGFAVKDENSERRTNYKLVEQAINEEQQILLAGATPSKTSVVGAQASVAESQVG